VIEPKMWDGFEDVLMRFFVEFREKLQKCRFCCDADDEALMRTLPYLTVVHVMMMTFLDSAV
jgi:hypothetical protein